MKLSVLNYCVCLSVLLAVSSGVCSQDLLSPGGLLTNLLSKPELSLITSPEIRFCWIVPSIEEGDYQTAYQIQVATSKVSLEQGQADRWDSGKTKSGQSTHVRYSGQPLQPGRSYYWRVKVWNKSDLSSSYSAIQQFNLGDTQRPKQWPGESEWVKIEQPGGEYLWTFEDRHPITYHPAYPVDAHRRANGTWFVDFEKAAFANISLTLNWKPRPGEPADTVVVVRLGEKSVGDSIDIKPGGGVIFRQYKLPLMAGTHVYHVDIPRFKPSYPHSQPLPNHMMEVIPFRYFEILGEELDLSVVSAEQMRLHTEVDPYSSCFISNDTLLNAVYDLCRYSVIANIFNGDYASSQRERMMYEADSYIHQMGHYAVDREFMTARYSLENMIYHATWPTEWISHAIMMVWADYLHTGDIEVIRKNYKDLRPKLMIALTMPNGMISTQTGLVTEEFLRSIHFNGKTLKDIVDWPHRGLSAASPGGETDNYVFKEYNTVVNAFHYHTLTLMEKMASAIGEKNDAKAYAERRVAFYKKFQKYFYDKDKGVYVDGIDTDHASLHANLFPLAFGLVPEGAKPGVIDYIKTKNMACGVYSANYLLEGLYDEGEAGYAMQLLTSRSDRSWYNMIRVGATMTTEAWDNKYKTNNGWSHAWSSSPAHILPRKVLGIEPASPGFDHIRIKPQLSGLSRAEGKLPTIKGEIRVKMETTPEKTTLTASTPANTRVDIYIPLPDKAKKYSVRYNGNIYGKQKEDKNYIVLTNLPSGNHLVELVIN